MGDVTGLAGTPKELGPEDEETLRKDLETATKKEKSPVIQELINKNAGKIKNLVEMVNHQTKQGYGGMNADDRQLVADWIVPGDYGKSSWDRTRASGTETFISGTTAEDEGFIIFGWMNQQDKPPVNAIKCYKGTEESPRIPLAFRSREAYDSTETPIVEQKRPLQIGPETKYEIDDYAPVSGSDSLQPLGFYVKTASDAWSL